MISFHLQFPQTSTCDVPDSADKGVELALRRENDGFWIPLAYYFHCPIDNRRMEILIGNFISNVSLRIRGYDVPAIRNSTFEEQIDICDPAYTSQSVVQLRWLQTSQHNSVNSPPFDVWRLDNVSVSYSDGSTEQTVLKDTFETKELK